MRALNRNCQQEITGIRFFSRIPVLFMLLQVFAGLTLLLSAPVSQAATAWEDISTQVSINTFNPIRSRRLSYAQVNIEVSNNGTTDITDPLRLVLGGLTPDTVSLQSASGATDTGEPYLDLAPYVGDVFTAGSTTGQITLVILNGGRTTFNFTPRIEQQVSTEPELLTVNITSPATLITVGSTPLQVNGTINKTDSALTLNGIPVTHSNGQFSGSVNLEEGSNTIVARAVDSLGNQVTDSIAVSMDLTPPYITVENPADGQVVYTPTIVVSGLVNDIVRGTVSDGQANVVINGVAATVSNRSYLSGDVPLLEGDNLITIEAYDQVGNSASITVTVRYQPPALKHISLQSGQNQRATIRTELADALAVKLTGTDGSPVAGSNVVYRVTQGDGVIGAGSVDEAQAVLAVTDANGIATTRFKLGSRAGNGNHHVLARAVGFDGEVTFYASADTSPGDKISINSGNNQRGATNQPLPQPFVVAVTDAGANVVEGATVEYSVTRGDGVFQNDLPTYTTQTDSDGRATAHFTLGTEAGLDVHRISATLVGTDLTAGFTASALQAGDAGNTRVSGIVLDNQDTPLPGVTVRIEGSNRQQITDAQGLFLILDAPVGPVHLLVDGSTTSIPGEWPTLSYKLVTVAGAENPLPAPIYMVKLDVENAVQVGTEDAVLTLPEVPGFKLEVKAGSVTFPDGSHEGLVSVTPVNSSKIPMAPPNGMQPQFIVTIQPVGTKFDPPAPLTLPNVDGHFPGAQVEMYSYDHDLEEFVAIGLGTVSQDGSVVKTNTGVGVIKAGWHCGSQPEGSGCADACPTCKQCNGDCNCVADDSQDPGECEKCSGGSITPDDSDTPTSITDTPNDCKQPVCVNGSATEKEDENDQPSDVCQICVGQDIKDIGLEVMGVPDKICVGDTETFTALLTPPEAAQKYSGPTGEVASGTGSVSMLLPASGTASMTGVSAHADKTKITFKPFPGGDACATEVRELLVLPRNIEGIPGKINRFTAHSFQQAECPNYPDQDTRRNHDVDGCSGGIAQDPVNFGGLYIPYVFGSQQYNRGQSTAFGQPQGLIAHANVGTQLLPLACNGHDICYQTCGETQASCDTGLLTVAQTMCGNVYPAVCPAEFVLTGECADYADERELCFSLANDTHTGLVAFGSPAFTERQTQYCLCCGNP